MPFLLGGVVGVIGLLYAAYGLVRTVVLGEPLEPGWYTVLATLHLIGGSILCSVSLVGECCRAAYTSKSKVGRCTCFKESSPPFAADSETRESPPGASAA